MELLHKLVAAEAPDVLALSEHKLSEEKQFGSLFFDEKEKLLALLRHFLDKSGKYAVQGYPHKLCAPRVDRKDYEAVLATLCESGVLIARRADELQGVQHAGAGRIHNWLMRRQALMFGERDSGAPPESHASSPS